jgi:4-amino-4-deoxy-L-arabinose transferase-like glycosyltransferase
MLVERGRLQLPAAGAAAIARGAAERVRAGLANPAVGLTGVMVAAFAARLWFGMRLPLEADEATTGFAAYGITQGSFVVTESNLHYLGALEAYIVAPFVAVFGPTLIAVRLAMSLMGAIYVLAVYALGRVLLGGRREALVLAAVAGFFPLFELTWNTHARWGYAEMMVFEAACLALAIRLAWQGQNRVRDWLLLGLLSGVALWNDMLIAVVLVVIVLAFLTRIKELGAQALRGSLLAALGAIFGFSPWFIYQWTHELRGLNSLPDYEVGLGTALTNLFTRELPIFVGTAGSCERLVLPMQWTWMGLAVIVAGTLWLRRESLGRLLRGRRGGLEPIDMVLAVGPVAGLAVTVGRFNGTPCQPRYLLPLALPLALAASLLLLRFRWPLRAAFVALAVAYLGLAAATASGPTVDSSQRTVTGMQVPPDPGPAAAQLRSRHLEAVFADYWLARPIQYRAGGEVLVGVYAGPVGFSERQRAAERVPHPSYLFVSGDPTIARLEELMRRRGITAQRETFDGLVLYANLSAPIYPADLGLPASYSD